MKNATFYLLDNDTHQDGLSAVEQLVCEIAAERWRAGKRVLIACEDEQQAIRPDEALWARPPESFVPHNLSGEGPRGGHRWRLRPQNATAARATFSLACGQTLQILPPLSQKW